MYRTRYTDTHGNAVGDKDVDLEDFGDFYETQPGDSISRTTRHTRGRKKSLLALGFLTFGTILVLVGLAMIGKEEELASERAQGIFPIAEPTEAPQLDDGDVTDSPTQGPTHSSMYSFVSSLIGKEALEDSNSIAYKAMEWLEDEQFNSIDKFNNNRLKRRFSLACLYISTNDEKTWLNDDKWMTAENECIWYGVKCKDNRLISLNLTKNGLEGLVPWEITYLGDHLLALDLSRNELANKNQGLAWLGELENLIILDIEQTLFSFQGIPHYISRLTDLQILDISECFFTGELDGSIFEPLEELLYLEIGGNYFNSTIPPQIYNLPKLEALYAYEVGLTGDLSFVPALRNVFELWLDDNPGLVGTIPTAIGRLTSLASLSLSNCELKGQIPSEIGNLKQMQQMWFFGNQFSGSIPTEFAKLPNLKILGLENNNLVNIKMPQEICDLNMISLSADCAGQSDFLDCDCCTCCESPCPVASLPVYEQTRMLDIVDGINRF